MNRTGNWTAAGVLCSTVVLLASISRAAEPPSVYPPTLSVEEVRQRVDRCQLPHPRLLATAAQLDALRQTLDADPLRRSIAEVIVRQATLLHSSAPVERKLEGRRLLGVSRRCVSRVVTLAMAWHLTGDQQHVERCRQEMLAAARFSDWNPSHFLDVAEMTFALALGYDWLYDQLDADSRAEIRAAIVEKSLRLPFETRYKSWVRARNNWGQVCHGGLTAGALALLEDEPELAARTVHNALHNVTYAMAAYAPEGGYPEGPGYWSYGTSYNVLLLGVLESVFGTGFGLSAAPGWDQTGQFPALATGPSGLFFNYADGGASHGPQPVLFWFADRYKRPDWLFDERARWQEAVAELSRRSRASDGGRLMALALLWMRDRESEPEIRMPLHWSSGGETPITIHRSSWTDPHATYLGLKAGSPSGNHGQMDIGSFVLDSDGVRWAMDLGAEGYNGIESRGMNLWSREQDSDRWTIFRQSNAGHNTLVIDGQLQRAAGAGEVIRFSGDPAFPHSVVDMSSVYEGQAASVQRGVALLPSREVVIQDQLTGLKPGSRVRWGMITPGDVDSEQGVALTLRQQEVRLTLRVLVPPAVLWQTIDTARPRNDWDSPNRGTRMVAFEAVAPASGELTLVVLATPGSCSASLRETLETKPLDRWGR